MEYPVLHVYNIVMEFINFMVIKHHHTLLYSLMLLHIAMKDKKEFELSILSLSTMEDFQDK